LLDTARQRIERRFPNLAVSRTSEVTDRMGFAALLRVFVWGLSLITVLIGGVGMMNTMIMPVVERTREIGLLRALSWRKRRVPALILSESPALTLLGGIIGVCWSLAMVRLLALRPTTASIGLRFTPGLLAQALVLAVVLGAVGGLYPAWRATRMRPVEALRYE
jgi:putative ABC transport system permease protein